jgi:hypothetical protein
MNLYEYVKGNPINGIDPSGQLACCCCCVKSVEIKNVTFINAGQIPGLPGVHCGNRFEVHVQTEYKGGQQGKSDCRLEWWENTDLVPEHYRKKGIEANTWTDVYAKITGIAQNNITGSPGGTTGWRNRRKPCPGIGGALMIDPPALTLTPGRTDTRNTYFRITVRSSPGCCSVPSLTATASQTTVVTGGLCTSSTFTNTFNNVGVMVPHSGGGFTVGQGVNLGGGFSGGFSHQQPQQPAP